MRVRAHICCRSASGEAVVVLHTSMYTALSLMSHVRVCVCVCVFKRLCLMSYLVASFVPFAGGPQQAFSVWGPHEGKVKAGVQQRLGRLQWRHFFQVSDFQVRHFFQVSGFQVNDSADYSGDIPFK